MWVAGTGGYGSPLHRRITQNNIRNYLQDLDDIPRPEPLLTAEQRAYLNRRHTLVTLDDRPRLTPERLDELAQELGTP